MKISLKNVSKVYKTRKPRCKLIGGLFGIEESKTALKDINIDIHSGECVGIIGANGSGKSTLLKLICKITSATEGEVQTNGKISALLELGAGFNPEYTGISNIYLNGMLCGETRAQTRAKIPEIARFADIGDYIKRPVKTYSDGMFLRLAFACAVSTEPDILVVDEALAVGDFAFRQKCFAKIRELNARGTTIIMVSHDIDTIRSFCERAIWLDDGRVRLDGDVMSVSAAYMESVTGCAGKTVLSEKADGFGCVNRFGSAKGSILSVSAPAILQTGEMAEFLCTFEIPAGIDLDNLAFSMSIKNGLGLDITVISTADEGLLFDSYGRHRVKITAPCYLSAGEYSICVSLEDRGSIPIKYYDYAEGVQSFRVVSKGEVFGIYRAPAEIEIMRGESGGAEK